MRDSLVVDSSVAVKWYLPESGSDRAADLLRAGLHLIAPDLLLAEIGNVLWKRRSQVPTREIEAVARALTSACPVVLHPSTTLFEGALAVALAYDRSLYDSLYLALAVSQGCTLITADERLCNALEKTDLAAYLQLL